MNQWIFDRSQLLNVLSTVKPMVGSKINQICDYVRFSIIANNDGSEAEVWIYGTNQSGFICAKYGIITPDSGSYEPTSQNHFLIEHKKLSMVLKSSAQESVLIKQTRAAEYDDDQNLTVCSRYKVQTEGKNFFQSKDVLSFPHETFEGHIVHTYEAGVFPQLWAKGGIAKGELDIARTCLHYDGNFVTIDNAFLCVVQTDNEPTLPDGARVWASVNLESGVSEVVQRMLGRVEVRIDGGGNKIHVLDEATGIYLAIRLAATQPQPYLRALDAFEYPHQYVVSKSAFEASLKRARAFMDMRHTSAVKLQVSGEDGNWSLLIKTPEDESGQHYEESIAIIEANGSVDAAYNVINLIKGLEAFDEDSVLVKVRDTEQGQLVDKGMCIYHTGDDCTVNVLLPSMTVSRGF